MGKVRGTQSSSHFHILDQLQLPGSLQGQPHEEHVAVIQVGSDQNMCDLKQAPPNPGKVRTIGAQENKL